jgi:hypothetical protein
MELIKLLPKPKRPTETRAYVRKDAHQEQWLQDIHRHCKQMKRCCQTANNKDLRKIESEVNVLLESVND